MFIPTCSEPTVPVSACCTVTLAGGGVAPAYVFGCLEGEVFHLLDSLDVLGDVLAATTADARSDAYDWTVGIEANAERLIELACL